MSSILKSLVNHQVEAPLGIMKRQRHRTASDGVSAIAVVAILLIYPRQASADIIRQYIRVSCATNLHSAKMEYAYVYNEDPPPGHGFVALEDIPQFHYPNDVNKGLPVCKRGVLSKINIKALGWGERGPPQSVLIYRNNTQYVDPIFFDFEDHEFKIHGLAKAIFNRPRAHILPDRLCSTESVCVRSVLRAPTNLGGLKH